MKKSILIITSIVLVLLLCFSGCSGEGETESSEKNEITSAKIPELDFDAKPSKGQEVENADTFITLNDQKIEIEGEGAEQNGTDIIISKGGTYAISGTLSGGRVIVKAGNGEITVILNGAAITCEYSSAFLVKKASKVTITANKDSLNILKDALNYDHSDDYSDSDKLEPDACIYSEENLTLNGEGTLLVQGNHANGVTSKSNLNIENISLGLSAESHGITGKESLVLTKSAFKVIAGRDGLRSNSTAGSSAGAVTLSACNASIVSGEDGIQAETTLSLKSGRYDIECGGGSKGTPTSETSAKALKGVVAVEITNGKIAADSLDDSIHSNGNVNISGGTMNLRSGDDAIHADQDITIAGGTVEVNSSYEGLEATNVTLSGGDVALNTTDDGINISGGDGSSETGRPGMDMFCAAGGKLTISGGAIVVNAEGDGFDANGDIEILGGQVIINGPQKGANGVLDFDGTFNITGGELLAIGSSSMSQAPSDTSTQNSLIYTGFSAAANELFSILASDGSELLTYASTKNFGWVCYSSPNIKKDETYTAYYGGSHTGNTKKGIYSDGKYTSGTKIADIKVENTVNSNGSTNGGFGGFGGGFGGEGRPNFDDIPSDFEGLMPPDGQPPEGFNGDFPTEFEGHPPKGNMPFGNWNGNGSKPSKTQ